MDKLKNCPFCGSSEINNTTGAECDDNGFYTLVCPECICVSPITQSKDDGNRVWNTRETESPWISVEDELPESYGNRYCTGTSPMVDVYADDERWTDCYYDYDSACFRCPDMDCIVIDVTHFMYVPKPPTGEK